VVLRVCLRVFFFVYKVYMNKKLERELRDADNLFSISDKLVNKRRFSKKVIGCDMDAIHKAALLREKRKVVLDIFSEEVKDNRLSVETLDAIFYNSRVAKARRERNAVINNEINRGLGLSYVDVPFRKNGI
jgi:hypothetical protein